MLLFLLSLYSVGSQEMVHLSEVACGDRLEETLVMIKSALMFRTGPLTVHIFADDMLRPDLKIQVQIKLELLRKKGENTDRTLS